MKNISYIVGYTLIASLIVAGAIGWGKNIYKLCEYDTHLPFSAVTAVRAVGLVTPIGSVVGYMTFEGEK